MAIQVLTRFFMWCTIINGVLLLFSSTMCTFAGDYVYKKHSRWFAMSRESFNVVIYSFVGLFKILFLMFNLVPYVALVIVG